VTEELWGALGKRDDYSLITAKWPEPGATVDVEAKLEIEWVIELVSSIRAMRAELNIPPSAHLFAIHEGADLDFYKRLNHNRSAIQRLARIHEPKSSGTMLFKADAGTIDAGEAITSGAAQVIVENVTFTFPLEGIIDIAAEKTRLAKALEASTKEAKSLKGRLSNPAFVEKAKPEAVDKARADHAAHATEAERLAAAQARVG